MRVFARSAFIAGSAAAASLRTALPADAQSAPIRVAGIAIDVAASMYYASEMGFFKKHGIDVDVVTGANGPAIAAAVIGGSLDIGSGNTIVLSQGHERGLPFALIAPSGAYRSVEPTAALLVAKTAPFKSARDLAGKTIGVNTVRAVGEVAVRAWLDQNGVSGTDIKYVEVPYSAMDAALVAGRIDAGMAEEPAVAAMVAANSRVLARAYDAIGKQFIEGGYFCTLEYAKAHPDAIRRFADAIAETHAWANTHREQTFEILGKYGRVPPPKTMVRAWYPERLRTGDLQPLIDVSVKYGLLQKAFPAKDLFV